MGRRGGREHLGAVEVAGGLEVDAEAVLLGLVAAGGAAVPREQPALPVLALLLAGLLLLLVGGLGRRAREGRAADVVGPARRVVRLVVRPVLRVRVAVGAARAVVALPVYAALCNSPPSSTPLVWHR